MTQWKQINNNRLSVLAVTTVDILTWFVLTNPNNPFTNLFQKPISILNDRILIALYTDKWNFRLLKELIVSLLNPAIPYEASLLENKKILTGRYQSQSMKFLIFSILGHKFGNDYASNSATTQDKYSNFFDQTGTAYNNGEYQNTIDIFTQIDKTPLTKNMRFLRAWSCHRTDDPNLTTNKKFAFTMST